MKNLLIILGLILTTTQLVAQTSIDYVNKGNEAIQAKNEELALQYYKKAIASSKTNAEAYIGASLMYSRIGNRQSNKATQKSYFLAAKNNANAALKLDSKNAQANYAMSVAMGRMALISGSKDKVAASRDIKKYAEQAIALNPKHADAWLVLGKWNFAVANLNFAEKAAANMLFGGLPEGSIDKAVKCFEKSMSLDPKIVLNYLELGKSYMQANNNSKAKNIFSQGLKLQDRTQDDPSYKKEIRALLNKL